MHSYVDLALPTWERQANLREVYAFDCACVSCSGGASGVRAAVDVDLVADVDGHGAVPRGAGAPCPLPLAPASTARDEDLAEADVLVSEAAAEEDAMKELGMLVKACKLREQWLHPRHIEVVAAHAAAHTAAMAAGAWPEAKTHCQKLVDQYLHVYPAWHPLSGLQIYCLAQLKEDAGQADAARSWYERAEEILRLTHGENHSMVTDLQSHLKELAC